MEPAQEDVNASYLRRVQALELGGGEGKVKKKSVLELLEEAGTSNLPLMFAAQAAQLCDMLAGEKAAELSPEQLVGPPERSLRVVCGAVARPGCGGANAVACTWGLAVIDVLLALSLPPTEPLARREPLCILIIDAAVCSLRNHPMNCEVLDAAGRSLRRVLETGAPGDGLATARHAVASGACAAIVDAMRAAPDEARVQARTCAVLSCLARAGGEQLRREAVKREAPARVLAALQEHAEDREVQAEGLGCLSAFITTPAAAAAAAQAGALRLSANALAAHLVEEPVACAAATCLRKLSSFSPALHAQASATPTPTLLASALQHHTASAEAAAAFASALGAICEGSPAAAEEAAGAGAVRMLCEALGMHGKSSPSVCHACCGALVQLAQHAPDAANLLRAGAAPDAACAVLRRHAGAPRLAGRAAALLARCASRGLARECAAAGAAQPLVAALVSHSQHAELGACVSLACLALALGSPQSRSELLSAGAAPALVLLLRAQPGAAGAALPACSALLALCDGEGGGWAQQQAAQAGGAAALTEVALLVMEEEAKKGGRPSPLLPASLRALARVAATPLTTTPPPPPLGVPSCDLCLSALASRHPSTAAAAAEALAAVCCASQPLAQRARAKSTISTLIAALARSVELSPPALPLAQQLAACLRVLAARDAEAKTEALKSGALPPLLAAMRAARAASAMPVLAAIAGALGSVAVDEGAQRALMCSGGAEAVVEALRETAGRTENGAAAAAAALCVCVSNLAADGGSERSLVRCGALEAVLAALRAHGGEDGGVVEEACAACANLVFDAPHAERARAAGARELLDWAASRHESKEGVLAQVRFAVQALEGDGS